MSEKKIVLKTGTSLGTFLDTVISESVKSGLHQKALQEKEKQAAASGSSQGSQDNSGSGDGDDIDLFSDDENENGSGDTDQASSSKTMDDETEKLKQGDVETKDIVDKLNSIRSGKSFKDETVSSAMDQYVGSLSKAERTALLAFLKGIAQIVTGEVSGGEATEPDSNPADVQMKKGPEASKTKHIQPNVIKATAPKEKVKGGAEDTSGPVPITPKKK